MNLAGTCTATYRSLVFIESLLYLLFKKIATLFSIHVRDLVFMYTCVCSDLKEIASLIETGAYAREVRRIMRVVRLTMALRRKLNATVLASFLNFSLTPGSELHGRLFSYLPKVILDAL